MQYLLSKPENVLLLTIGGLSFINILQESLRQMGINLIAINGMPDHVHLLFGLRPIQSLSDLMQDVKSNSSKWINNKGFVRGKFSWQEELLRLFAVEYDDRYIFKPLDEIELLIILFQSAANVFLLYILNLTSI